jgi:S1-C subfamily serine protease
MEALQTLSSDLATAVERAARAVVAVNARPRMPSSGVHWRSGVIVTAEHTVQVDEDITISDADGRRVPATLAGRDPSTDLAVLTVAGAATPAAELDGPGSLKPGHIVLALGYGPRVSWGVVSAVGGVGRARGRGEPDPLLRLDLVLYPGFSGGPLVDVAGRVTGINTSGLSRTGAIAIPAATVTRITDELLRKGRIARGYLGVGLQPVRLPENLKPKAGGAGQTGLIVVSIEPDGPAGQAGLLLGDVLLALDGTPITSMDDIQAVLGPDRVGSRVSALIIRAGQSAEVVMTVGERPPRRR